MTMIAWAECKNGHSMTDPANVYVTPNGWRRCRTCRRESDRRCRPERTPLRSYPNATPVRPHKFRGWAQETWEQMSEFDRFLVGHALGYLSLEQAVL